MIILPLVNPPASGGGTPVGSMGLMSTNPGAVPGGYSWVYNSAAKTLPAYTASAKSSAYTGGLLDLLQAAKLTDINDLRVAYENLRVFTENIAKQHNQISLDLLAAGLISNA